MFDNLTGKLDKAFQVLKGHGKITEINVAETLKEVRRALLDADVNISKISPPIFVIILIISVYFSSKKTELIHLPYRYLISTILLSFRINFFFY